MIYLGIDYGKAKIGLALAEGVLASPLAVFINNKKVLGKIAGLCQQQGVDQLVVGMPEGDLVAEIKTWAKKLVELTGLPLEFESETLTSQEAIVKMVAAGRGRKFRQEKEDAFAAAVILQNYLDRDV